MIIHQNLSSSGMYAMQHHTATPFRFSNEPSRQASWRGLVIDHTMKGQTNPLNGTLCFGGLLAPSDAIFLLWDIEKKCS